MKSKLIKNYEITFDEECSILCINDKTKSKYKESLSFDNFVIDLDSNNEIKSIEIFNRTKKDFDNININYINTLFKKTKELIKIIYEIINMIEQ